MRIFVHFGIYKAGSSYIQYLCANSREYLQQHGYFFPASIHDRRMLAGQISPGNADGLDNALRDNNGPCCKEILQKWRAASEQNGCSAVLISAEALSHHLADKTRMNTFVDSAFAAGFEEIHAMGFLRDLADHAISTFKHRGKSGAITDFGHWLQYTYETPQLLVNLSDNRRSDGRIRWVFRKFSKQSDALEQAFFEDWLKVPRPNFERIRVVNESVTLSEVMLMQHIRKLYPQATDFFVNRLKSLDKASKANDKGLERTYYNKAVSVLNKKNVRLDLINAFLDEPEKLTIGFIKESTFLSNDEIMLSARQLDVLAQCLGFFRTARGRLFLIRRGIVNFLPRSLMKIIVRNLNRAI